MSDTTTTKTDSTAYTIFFALIVGLICASLVSVASVVLKPRQDANARLYMEKNVLIAAGLVEPGTALTVAEVNAIFAESVVTRLIDLETGQALDLPSAEARQFDQRLARNDPETSDVAPDNDAGIRRLPERAPVFFIEENGTFSQVVIPVDGLGMWGTVYGFLSLGPDADTVKGMTFYEHKETPGLGAEIANPDWLEIWEGRRAYDDAGNIQLTVIKGQAGSAADDPYRIDGLAGATITGDAVTRFIQFWLGERGFKPFLDRVREGEFS